MYQLFIFFFFLSTTVFSQGINQVDASGLKQGKWKKSYENGSLRYEGFFKDNNPVGIFTYYYPSSEVYIEKEFFHNGEAAAAHFFYKSGALKASGLYVNELKDSTWNYFNTDSILIGSEQYKDGNLHGMAKTFYDSGELYEAKRWENGVKHGEWKQFYIDGTLKMKCLLTNGKQDGYFFFYHPNGELNIKGNYDFDEKIGVWMYYNENSKLDTTINFIKQ